MDVIGSILGQNGLSPCPVEQRGLWVRCRTTGRSDVCFAFNFSPETCALALAQPVIQVWDAEGAHKEHNQVIIEAGGYWIGELAS
jgi:hypothetical protein